MFASFLKGFVTGAARGAAKSINAENQRMRESFDTAAKMFLDQVTKERQIRSLKRTEIMGNMKRIQGYDTKNILTAAELYILAGNEQNFANVINDLEKQYTTIDKVQKNIAFAGKTSPKYASKEQAIEANLAPSIAVRPQAIQTTTAFGIKSPIQQRMAADLEAAVPTGSMEARDAQGQILPRVGGTYKPAMDPNVKYTSASQIKNLLEDQKYAIFNQKAKLAVTIRGQKIFYIRNKDQFTGKPLDTYTKYVDNKAVDSNVVAGTDPIIEFLESESAAEVIRNFAQGRAGDKRKFTNAETLALESLYAPYLNEYNFSSVVKDGKATPDQFLKYGEYHKKRTTLKTIQDIKDKIEQSIFELEALRKKYLREEKPADKNIDPNVVMAKLSEAYKDQLKRYGMSEDLLNFSDPKFYQNLNSYIETLKVPSTFAEFYNK